MIDRPDLPERERSSDGGAPLLCVIIDTEEEFDWSVPHARENRSVRSIGAQERAQAIFARYGIVPTYVVDYPVAAEPDAVAVLKEFQESGAALIGAHLHPWVNPPYEEAVSAFNSYPGNLPPELEAAKLRALTERIESAFGRRPRVYKAGRYGIGPNTPRLLAELGYRVDASVVPYTSFAEDGGPDFRAQGNGTGPFGGEPGIMELPLTVGFTGALRRVGPALFPLIGGSRGVRLHLPGALARTGLLERIRLSPEGADADDHIRLTEALMVDGQRVFSYTYHSPSLEPGHTPYVAHDADLRAFLDRMDRYFDYFLDRLGGAPATPLQIYQSWRPR